MGAASTYGDKLLRWLLILYCLASLLHFAHNAEYVADYPSLPAWLTRSRVYVAWLGITALGVVGYVVYLRGHRLLGLAILAVYAALGLDGLLHYGRASFAAHTAAMNFTIWLEVVAAVSLLVAIAAFAAQRVRVGFRDDRG